MSSTSTSRHLAQGCQNLLRAIGHCHHARPKLLQCREPAFADGGVVFYGDDFGDQHLGRLWKAFHHTPARRLAGVEEAPQSRAPSPAGMQFCSEPSTATSSAYSYLFSNLGLQRRVFRHQCRQPTMNTRSLALTWRCGA